MERSWMSEPVQYAGVLKEKDALELQDKKVEIQKKQMEVRKERLMIRRMKQSREAQFEEQRITLEMLYELRQLLTDWTIDEDRTIMASEPFLKPAINENRREVITRKIMELVNKL